MLSAISNGVLGLHRERYGRGAERARTIMHGDFVVTFLYDIFTAGEKTLIEAGHYGQVREMRQTFQDTVRTSFTETVEAATGRKVVAFFSQVHAGPDMALEGFVLEPDARAA